MRRKFAVSALVFGLLAVSTLLAQRGRRFQSSPFDESGEVATPKDANEKTEWAFARLRYPSIQSGNQMWSMRGNWAIDYPKADRQFVSGVRRLSRVHARSVEQVVDLDKAAKAAVSTIKINLLARDGSHRRKSIGILSGTQCFLQIWNGNYGHDADHDNDDH